MKYPLINSKLSLIDLLDKLDTGKRYSFEGKVFCPFHYNTVSPAAKLFRGDAGDTLYCFAEVKTYRPVDVLKLLNYDLDLIEKKLEEKYGAFSENNTNYYKLNVKTDLFKQGKISLMDYCLYIKNKEN